ncbi:MAG: mechanosensitive ion channel family protein [Gammaproteobacteria bacterium]|nr:mechanosensitive ion channel family protein [Gammaproteobacteria bacterium]MBU1624083.1 mechanosensitive ion channel family protein [Gammaproteobacteria bacterium]MBU1981811.1 mechanosensitive ion channel family protein [Gammaproteobacteria bacterium]
MENISFIDHLHVPTELLRVILTLIAAWILIIVSRKLIRVFSDYARQGIQSAEEGRRVETLARMLRYIFNVVIMIVAAVLLLSELGVSVTPILGAAGVVGIAVGFAAKSLIQDYFTGIFLLLENQIRQGDAVEISGKSGVVEDITLRYVALRDIEGNVHYIPNGQITILTNKSRGYAYALIEFGVAYREDLEEVYRVTRETAAELRNDPVVGPKILEDLEIQGVQSWADSAVLIRCRFKTEALEQWDVRRNFLGWLKKAFDAHGIEIPYPHLTLYAGQDKQGNAPALRIMQQPDK